MKETDFPTFQDYILSHRLFESERHGLTHWQQVECNGLLLASETGVNTTVVRLFALIHDNKQTDDGIDREHDTKGEQGRTTGSIKTVTMTNQYVIPANHKGNFFPMGRSIMSARI